MFGLCMRCTSVELKILGNIGTQRFSNIQYIQFYVQPAFDMRDSLKPKPMAERFKNNGTDNFCYLLYIHCRLLLEYLFYHLLAQIQVFSQDSSQQQPLCLNFEDPIGLISLSHIFYSCHQVFHLKQVFYSNHTCHHASLSPTPKTNLFDFLILPFLRNRN